MKKIWPEEIYQKISVLDLILIAFFFLTRQNKLITFEKLLKQCFDLFPGKFSFRELKLPDARKIDRSLRVLRKQKLISGNPKRFFKLTKKGGQKALVVIHFLRQKKLKLK